MPKHEQWFLLPLDLGTNKTIAGRLPESAFSLRRMEDGVQHGVWMCDREFVDLMEKDKVRYGLQFLKFLEKRPGKLSKVERMPVSVPQAERLVS